MFLGFADLIISALLHCQCTFGSQSVALDFFCIIPTGMRVCDSTILKIDSSALLPPPTRKEIHLGGLYACYRPCLPMKQFYTIVHGSPSSHIGVGIYDIPSHV